MAKPEEPGKLFRVLSIDGGGAKGFYTLGVLKEIEGLVGGRLNERFDLVYGTSTGAIIAALVCLGYPKQHSANCTSKHQATKQWFKPTVRMFKNMRNRMIEDKRIEDDLAPSYFLEGLLFNVPNGKFGSTYQSTFVDCINWLIHTDRSKFVCANERHWLFQDGSPVSWRSANCDRFLDAMVKFWNDA